MQSVNIDLSKVILYKDAVLKTLIDMRNTEHADNLYAATDKVLKENNLDTEIKSSCRNKRNKRKKLGDYVYYTTSGHREDATDSASLRRRLFYPALDRMISELSERFSPQSDDVYTGIHALNPSSESFLNVQDLGRLAKHDDLEVKE